jgi:histidine ammonia-lyase
MKGFRLGEDLLTITDIRSFIGGGLEPHLSAKREALLLKNRKVLDKLITGETYYGINTGFGRLANTKIEAKDLKRLQTNLIRSHAFGAGGELSRNIVRLMMLLRAHMLAMGYSGISLPPLKLLIEMIRQDLTPIVPEKGSVGASGDLSPLAYIALAMMGEGEVYYRGERLESKKALQKAGLKAVELAPRDGLALVNGTQAMTATGAILVTRGEDLIKLMDMAAALSVEGIRASATPFNHELNAIRNQRGQVKAAAAIRKMIEGSEIIRAHKDCGRVQDPYSFRCIPQVHGAVRDVYYYTREILEREMNACTDNPVILKDGRILSGGNFHGEPLALAFDAFAIAFAELGSISERRIEQLTNPKSHDLPVMFLTPNPGLNSGFMIPHVVAASLVSENKVLAHPASVDNIPTSAGQEDHVSMGMWGARKALSILDNLEWIAVIELMAAAEAIDLHEKRLSPGKGTSILYRYIRRFVKPLKDDRFLAPEAELLLEEIRSGRLIRSVERGIGRLEV